MTWPRSGYNDKAELRTPLHWAAMVGDARLVDFLLDKGADTSRLATGVSSYGGTDVTPLIAGFQIIYACHDRRKFDTAAFCRLLERATPEMINVRIREDNGCGGSNDAASPLAAACDMLELDLVNALLAKGADPNFPATSKCGIPGMHSPLTEAVQSYVFSRESQGQRAKRQKENAKRVEIAKALLAAGADVNLYKHLLSSVEGNAPMRELLSEHGASSMGPVTWSDDQSRAKIMSHGGRMFPSTEDLAGILRQQSLLELHLYAGSESMFQEVPGTSESVKKLTCSFGGGNGDIGDMEETALPLLSKFPRLEELTWNYAHESINEHQMLQLARVTPNLRVLRLHGDSEGAEGSRRIDVSDGGVACLSAALPLQSLWIGSSSFLTRASELVDYADDDHEDVWEAGAFDLSPKALEAMARHCPSLESVCLDSYEVDCFYNERETGSFEENQMPEKTVTIQLAPLRCLRHLALRLLLTDDNVASIAKAAPNLSTLALVSPLLTDAALAAVATCSELEALSFNGRCNVSDAGVVQLAGSCPRLQKVVIQCSRKLTAASIIALAKLAALRMLYLWGAKEGFATATACDSLRAGCVHLECLYLGGFRRMGADAMEALSQCTALRVLKLHGELSREDLERICDTFSSGFGALRMWSYSAPHTFRKSLIRLSGLELHSWEHVDRDMTPEHDAKARVRVQRPDIEVTGYLGVSDFSRPSTAIDAARNAYLNAFAIKKGILDVAGGYGSDDYDEDDGRGAEVEEASPVSLTEPQGSVAPAEELRTCTQCKKDLAKGAFANKQWKHVNRRCKTCTLAEQAAAAASPTSVHGEGIHMASGRGGVHEGGGEACVPSGMPTYLGVQVPGLSGGDENRALAAGAVVQLHSLKATPQHNGSRGVLVTFDAGSGRWAVRPTRQQGLFVGGVRVLNVKPANLAAVHAADTLAEGWVPPAKRGDGKSPADLVAALQALSAGADPSAPGKGPRTSLAKHLSKFTPNGGAWLVMMQAYLSVVQEGDRVMWQTLQDMAASTVPPHKAPTRPTPEATLATYLCGKLLKDDHAMRMLRMPKDQLKAAWCWVAAAQEGLAYAVCGLSQFMRDSIPNTALSQDLHLAKKLWAAAFALCDLPEAAHNLGVCFGLGHGGPVELPKAVAWYGAAKDCDLIGAIVGDTPRGRHGDLTGLFVLGPANDEQVNFINQV